MLRIQDSIKKVLNVLGTELEILPATGQALEILQRPDADEKEDIAEGKGKNLVKIFAEIPKPDFQYKPIKAIPRKQKHLFQYFIDGTLRTFQIATGLENERSFPLVFAQIGAAALKREKDGTLKSFISKKRNILLIPVGMISATSVNKIKKAVEGENQNLEIVDYTEKRVAGSDVDLMYSANGRARTEMRILERDISNSIERAADNWVVMDGSFRLGIFRDKIRQQTIGITKSFSKENVFAFGRELVSLPKYIAKLQFGQRTPVFQAEEEKFGFWYVRLHEQGEVDYPVMGVVKVDIPLPESGKVNSELVDELSGCLLAERFVSPYGKDQRWHAHLYPIFETEQFAKNMLYSHEVVRGLMQWPRLTLT